jgi:hypothetical protein
MKAVLTGEFKLAEHARNVWHVTAKVPFEDVLKPEYWVHVASNLRAFDEIIINADDGSFHAVLLVSYVQGKVIKLVPLLHKELNEPEADAPLPEGYAIKWGGRAAWRVIRLSDGAVIQDGFASKELAQQYLSDMSIAA